MFHNIRLEEVTSVHLGEQIMLPEQLQDHFQMPERFLLRPRKDKNVVEVDADTLVVVRPKN